MFFSLFVEKKAKNEANVNEKTVHVEERAKVIIFKDSFKKKTIIILLFVQKKKICLLLDKMNHPLLRCVYKLRSQEFRKVVNNGYTQG